MHERTQQLDRLVGITELSSILGVPKSWCYRHMHDFFRVVKVGKYRMVTSSSVAEFIESGGTDNDQ